MTICGNETEDLRIAYRTCPFCVIKGSGLLLTVTLLYGNWVL